MSEDKPDVDSIYLAAIELPDDRQRREYLDQACRGNAALRQRVDRLLHAQSKARSFLESPAPELSPTVDSPTSEKPGTVIGPYELMEQIGEGGMGVVFVARQEKPIRRQVALKVIKPGMDSKVVIARLEAERQALAMMDHPNIAKVLDAGTTDSGRPYFVMELVHGISITTYCDEHRLSVVERLELFMHVCRAIQHAHNKGIIHRDIKPSNVLVTEQDGEPVPKVIDFGIAKALSQPLTDRSLYTNFCSFMGTPLYASPEQASLSNIDVDTRSDVYSLGVLLYELLTGTTPFTKEQLDKAAYDEYRRLLCDVEPAKPSTRISELGVTLADISRSRRSEPSKLGKLVRGDLDWIVMKSLEKDRKRRYETAVGFALDIDRFLKKETVEARPPSTTYRVHKYVSRHRGLVTAMFLIFLSLSIGLTAAAVSWFKMRELLVQLRDELARDAMTMVLSGNEELAEFAIENAHKCGVEQQCLTILESLKSLYGGRPKEAADKVAAILQKDPDNTAALCVMAMSSMEKDDPIEAFHYQGRLRDPMRPPATDAIGNLLLAQVLLHRDPGLSHEITSELLARFPHWAAIRAYHGAATIQWATDMSDQRQMIELFDDGIANLRSAANMVPENQTVLTEYLYALTYAVELADDLDDDREEKWRKEAEELIAASYNTEWGGKRFGSIRAYYLAAYGGGLSEEQWNKLANRGNVRDCIMQSLRLYGKGDLSGCLRMLDEYRSTYPKECCIIETMVKIEQSDNPREVAQLICDREFGADKELVLEWHFVAAKLLLFAGDVAGARRYAFKVLEQECGYDSRWTERMMKYLEAPTLEKEERLLRQAGPFSVARVYVYSMVAMRALAEGDKEKASKYFDQTVATGKVDWFSYCIADALRQRMEQDGWPNWIESDAMSRSAAAGE